MNYTDRKAMHDNLIGTANSLLRRAEELAWASVDADEETAAAVGRALFTLLIDIGVLRRQADELLVEPREELRQ